MDEIMMAGATAVRPETATGGASHQLKRLAELRALLEGEVAELEGSLADILTPPTPQDGNGEALKAIAATESPVVSALREHGDFIEGQMERLRRLRARVEL
jgi:hypothetical protein